MGMELQHPCAKLCRACGAGSLRVQPHTHNICAGQPGEREFDTVRREIHQIRQAGGCDVPLTKLAFALSVAFAPAAPSVAGGGWEEGWEESTEQ